jgi:glyoxylase-like metal-dependent hydrolase (beta-lactamase superfamily II)
MNDKADLNKGALRRLLVATGLSLIAVTGVAGPAVSADSDVVVAPPKQIAPGVWLISGALRPKRQPDGNTVVFEGPKGLIVVDTGRHVAQREAIKAFAESRHKPIVAIVNSHWHLDHVSGNPFLKQAFPGAKVYASNAIEEALTGFLAKSAAEARPYLDSDQLPPETKEDLRADLATTANGQALRPDVVVDRSRDVTLAGRRMRLELAPNAATDGDVWVYDPKTRVAAVGDLVTLPAPFLDTACSEGWKTALNKVWATPFTTAIPGHGAPMTRAQFGAYRAAFSALIDCAKSSRTKTECAADWTKATADLRDPGVGPTRYSQGNTEYYVQDVLRAHGGKSASCKTA